MIGRTLWAVPSARGGGPQFHDVLTAPVSAVIPGQRLVLGHDITNLPKGTVSPETRPWL